MANATIHGYTFSIDPTTASWGYSMNVKQIDTYGGRVVQTLSCKIDKLTIGGYLHQPKGGFENRYNNMILFEKQVKGIMEYQSKEKKPVLFSYDALDWTAWVWLLGYKDVKYDVSTAAVSYSLTFEVENGFDALVKTAESYGLDLINSGVEYVRNEFNTPTRTWDDLRVAYERLLNDAGTMNLLDSLYDYLDQESASGADGASGGGGIFVPGGTDSDQNASAVELIASKINERSAFNTLYASRANVGSMRRETK